MSDFEFNKIFAALLLAGIVIWGTGFFADEFFFHPHKLEKDAVEIDGGPVEGGGVMAVALAEPAIHLVKDADVARGQKLSKACAACHSFDKGGATKQGPNLWNIVNRKKGSVSGFGYSSSLAEAVGAWDYTAMNRFLWKPKKYMPGTSMGFIGLKKPEDRAAMLAWLRTLADSPAGLPSDSQIAAEKADLTPPEPEVEPEADAASVEETDVEPDSGDDSSGEGAHSGDNE